MNAFSRKLKCLNCGKGMKFKKERSVGKYICSTYDLGKGCSRLIIDESFLLDLIERRYQCKLDDGEIRSLVEKVEVKSKYEFIIYFYNDDAIISMNGHIKF